MNIYSHSRLSCFEQCPQKFKWEYVAPPEGIEKKEGVEAFMGSRVHEALQKLYNDLKFTKTNSLEEILEYYGKEWKRHWSGKIEIVRQEYNPEHYKAIGENCLRDYYERYRPFGDGKTVGLEKKVSMKLDKAGKYKLTGYIDRLTLVRENEFEIHDYKTSANLPEQEEKDLDRQLALYQIAVEQKWKGVEKVELVWHYLAFNKEMRSHRTKENLEKLKQETIALIDKAENAIKENEFSPRESALCDWCSFYDICPAKRHIAETEKMSPEKFALDDGVRLANEYAEMSSRLEALNREMETLKTRIFGYAKQHSLEVIRGNETKLRVKEYHNLKFPAKNEPERNEIEALLKDNGLWDEVSELNVFALSNMLKEGFFEPKLAEMLKSYGQKEIARRIYMSKLREWEL